MLSCNVILTLLGTKPLNLSLFYVHEQTKLLMSSIQYPNETQCNTAGMSQEIKEPFLLQTHTKTHAAETSLHHTAFLDAHSPSQVTYFLITLLQLHVFKKKSV